jgi:ABC-type multidrug transport system fused ATPase/permease subunit
MGVVSCAVTNQAGEKIFDIISQSASIPTKGGEWPQEAARGELVVQDVSFAYKGSGSPILEGMSIRVNPGERVAIVGLSGSGKSSIISLLLRYYDPTAGKIFFDGRDISTLDPRYLKGHIGIVTQEPMLFGISLRENIAYARPSATDPEVEEAAKRASLHDYIMSLPQGYATVVGERGVTLSGGLRQRVGIARAVLRKPKLLILDEATSALDAHTESEVQAALKELHQRYRMTMLTIAHRLSTIQDSDRIIVMAKGRIVEQGTHAQLLTLNGVYKALVQRQLQEETILKQF